MMTTFEEYRDDVVSALDGTPESVLRRVNTFDKGVVAQIAVPRQIVSSRSSAWEGVKLLPWQTEWMERMLSDNVLAEETRGVETVYVLVPTPPAVSTPPAVPPNLPEGATITPNGELIVPFKQGEGIAPALNAVASATLTATDEDGKSAVTDVPIVPAAVETGNAADSAPEPQTEEDAPAVNSTDASVPEANDAEGDDKPAAKPTDQPKSKKRS
jgi:hypothetical protein